MLLTPSQRKAIEHEGRNLQLIACAGSGKTEVVARRVVHLLRPGAKEALAPKNIVAFTFTEKAAAELKERIITRASEELGEVIGLAEMFVGTIHAFCLELLKTEVAEYLKYEVLNEVQQGLFVDRHSSQSGLTTYSELLRIPFMIRLPGGRHAGEQSDALVQFQDLLPTLLELLGLRAGLGGDARGELPSGRRTILRSPSRGDHYRVSRRHRPLHPHGDVELHRAAHRAIG